MKEMLRSLVDVRMNLQAFRELASLLFHHWTLTFEMSRREITEKYRGQFFGTFWTIGHPLILMVVYIFVFGFVFRVNIGGTPDMPLDYTVYLLSGLIPWLSFQDSMTKASTVIVGNSNLVKQVIFPIEVLPVKIVIAMLFTQLIFLALLAAYTLITHHALLWTYFLLPLLLFLQALGMVGVSYILASTGPYLRDTKDFVQIFCTVSFYVMPMLYLPVAMPGVVRGVLYANPFSYLIWCYQDALYFGRFEHPWAWLIFSLLSLSIFIFGYRVFRRLKTMFGNVL
jgi:lipopolysaccharide transport system permease protein